MEKRGGKRESRKAKPEPAVRETFPTPDRFTRTGKRVGDICFECECRILQIGGPDGMLLAWCECGWPDEHDEMEIG
ncbi:MAG: hypothetical protein M3167_12480 [Acidobacteriota bacterium]|nr:hypothetical protein [Acidobacteriota bacterium]